MNRNPHSVSELSEAIRAEGFTVIKGKQGKHPRVLRPNGTLLMCLPSTPSDKRSVINTWTAFKRARHSRDMRLI